MSMRTLLLSAAAALALLASSCRGTSSYQSLPMPPQDVAVSRPDLARIYVMREGQARGRVRAVRVEDGDREIGALDQDEYLCWERAPGRTLLSFFYEGARIDGGDLEGIYSLDAAPGGVYYLTVHIDRLADAPELRARSGHPDIELLEASAGREAVRTRSAVPVR